MVEGGDKSRSGKLKLVVATNFSKKSEDALDFALTYTQNVHADVYLFHCYEEGGKDFRLLDRVNVQFMDRMKVVVMQALERLRQKGVSPTVEEVHRRMSHGKPPNEIREIASGIGADMIVMGAPTTKGFKDLTQNPPCTLVLVKEKER
jgi:nucleotide-binding universal stress UspA family protein